MTGFYVASRYYEINRLIDTLTYTKDVEGTAHEQSIEPIKIDWQEQVTLHFLISPIHRDEKSYLSKCLLPSEWSDNYTDVSVTDFICIEHAFEQFTVRLYTFNYFSEIMLII